MNYADVVRLVFSIITTVLGAILLHFIVYAIIGLFSKKTYPETEKKNRFGLIIPARNEESVVTGLIESIQKNNYPQDKLEIFVIAHNCSDNTAEAARKYGVHVYEYNNPEENTMGYAFRYLFSRIEEDFGTQNFDGFFLFNADNILDKDYFSKMNDAFEYYGRECVITSYRNSKNFGANIISGLYGMYFTVGCRFESRGRTVTGCSTRVQGTGYLINSNIVKNGWEYVSLAEDWEFTADQLIRDHSIRYCDAAVFYDEQPTSLHIMWRQRVRWARGHLLVFYSRFKDLLKKLFAKDTKHRVSVYDITAYILPTPLIYVILQILQIILLITAPLIDRSTSLYQIFIESTDFLRSNGMLFVWLRYLLASYIVSAVGAIVIFIAERKRIKNVSLWHKILITLTWPVFLGIQCIMDVQAFFLRNLGWKPIPHSDQTKFDHVNDTGSGETENKE